MELSSHPSSRPSTARSDASFATAITRRTESRDSPRSGSRDLETLKRQVRRRSQATRQLSQSSDLRLSEANNAFNHQTAEREEEMRWLREELQQVRAQREDEKEAAMRRIEELERQNDGLSVLVDQQREEEESQRGLSDQALEKAWRDLRGNEVELDVLSNQLHQASVETGGLETAYREEQASREAMMAENQDLRLQLAGASNPRSQAGDARVAVDDRIQEYMQRIGNLEETNRVAGERMQSVISTHKAREESLLQRHSQLQTRHDDLVAELASSQSRVDDLENSVLDHEIRRRELIFQIEEHKQHLNDANLEVEKHSHELSQLLLNYQNAKKDREEFRALLQESLSCTTEIEDRLRVTEARAIRAEQALERSDKDELARELAESNEELAEVRVEVLTMQGQLSEAQARTGEAESELETATAGLRADVLAKNNEIMQLQRRVDELQLSEAQARAGEAESEVGTSTAGLKADLLAKTNEIMQLQRRVDELQLTQDQNRDLLERTELEASMAADVIARSVEAAESRLKAAAAEREKDYRNALKKANATREVMQADMDALVKANASRESNQSDLSALQKKHDAALKQTKLEMQQKHETALTQARRELQQSHEEKMVTIEEKHEEALSAALADADDDMENRLRDQARNHGEELETVRQELRLEISRLELKLSEAETSRQEQTQHGDANKADLEALTEKLNAAEQTSTETSAKHETVVAESVALKARLEAEMIARREAELAVADLRKRQRASLGDKKVDDDTKEALQRRVVVLQAERDALTRQAESASASPRTPQRAPLTPPMDLGSPDLENLRQRNSELSRQNDFLAKELEGAMSRISTPQPALAQPAVHNAAVQTEVETDNIGKAEDLESHDRGLSQSSIGARSQIDEEALRLERRRSLENFLDQAQIELADFGSAIGTSEALLAMKMREHVGDLQIAKTQLAKEFQAEYNALLTRKEQMERTVSAKTAADFYQDRLNLLATYGVSDMNPPASFSASTRQALRNAEGSLVAEHDRNFMLRKSQISLQHVGDLQMLTQDYDRKISTLLNSRDRPWQQGLNRAMSPLSQRGLVQLEPKSSRSELRVTAVSEDTGTSGDMNPRIFNKAGVQTPEPTIEATDFAMSSPQLRKKPSTGGGLSKVGATAIPRAVPYGGRGSSIDRNVLAGTQQQNLVANSNIPSKVPSEPYQPTRRYNSTTTATTHQQPQDLRSSLRHGPHRRHPRQHQPTVPTTSELGLNPDDEELAEESFGTFAPIPQPQQQRPSEIRYKSPPKAEKRPKRSLKLSSSMIYLQAANG